MNKHFSTLIAIIAVVMILTTCALERDSPEGTELSLEIGVLPEAASSKDGAKALAADLAVKVKAFIEEGGDGSKSRTQVGSTATLTWDAVSQKYKGSMTIPDNTGQVLVVAYATNADNQHVARASATTNITTGTSSLSLTASPDYAICDAGPGGGPVFYDKGSYSDGWRYMEVSPLWDLSWEYNKPWGVTSTLTNTGPVEDFGVGYGMENTTRLVFLQGSGSIYAAPVADGYSVNGESDWFLPSVGELKEMHRTIAWYMRPPNTDYAYWSSSEYDADNAYVVYMDASSWWGNPYVTNYPKNEGHYLRFARRF